MSETIILKDVTKLTKKETDDELATIKGSTFAEMTPVEKDILLRLALIRLGLLNVDGTINKFL